MEIAPAVPEDETAVVRLWRDCGLVVPHNDPAADFRLARGKPNSDILVSRDADGEIVAAVMVGHDGHRGWLYYFAVAPDRQRRGLGRAMALASERWLSERKIKRIQLMVRETNSTVVEFYERLGYAVLPRTTLQKRLD